MRGPARRQHLAVAALGLGLGLALTGCSGDTPDDDRTAGSDGTPSSTASTPSDTPSDTAGVTPAPPATSTPPSEPSGPDPVCGGLELDVVRDVLGPKMRNPLAQVDYCLFAGPRDRPTLIVSAIPTLGDPAEFAAEQRDFCDSDLTDVPEVGDAAWVCLSPTFGPQGYVVDGEAFVQLDLTSGDDRADLASLVRLLPSVVVPTGLEFPE